ncbi:hypothetical protein [Streptococcus pasteurianus]
MRIKYTPNVEDETVDFGGKVDLTDNVTNLGDLPSGNNGNGCHKNSN